jgi:hypothetical protein
VIELPAITFTLATTHCGEPPRVDEVKHVLDKATAIRLASFDMHVRERVPRMGPERRVFVLDGLRKAGWQG